MTKFKQYRRISIAEMRPYVPGEDLTGVSVAPGDVPTEGGMIARDPKNHTDMWYVNPLYFSNNFEEM